MQALRELLASIHSPSWRPQGAGPALPHGLIVDGLPLLFAPTAANEGPAASQHTPSRPSPSKPAQQGVTMHLSLALAAIVQAADFIDGALGGAAPLLLVACAAAALEPELASRWLPAQLLIAPAPRGRAEHVLSCRAAGEEEACAYTFDGRELRLLAVDPYSSRLQQSPFEQFAPELAPAGGYAHGAGSLASPRPSTFAHDRPMMPPPATSPLLAPSDAVNAGRRARPVDSMTSQVY